MVIFETNPCRWEGVQGGGRASFEWVAGKRILGVGLGTRPPDEMMGLRQPLIMRSKAPPPGCKGWWVGGHRSSGAGALPPISPLPLSPRGMARALRSMRTSAPTPGSPAKRRRAAERRCCASRPHTRIWREEGGRGGSRQSGGRSADVGRHCLAMDGLNGGGRCFTPYIY